MPSLPRCESLEVLALLALVTPPHTQARVVALSPVLACGGIECALDLIWLSLAVGRLGLGRIWLSLAVGRRGHGRIWLRIAAGCSNSLIHLVLCASAHRDQVLKLDHIARVPFSAGIWAQEVLEDAGHLGWVLKPHWCA